MYTCIIVECTLHHTCAIVGLGFRKKLFLKFLFDLPSSGGLQWCRASKHVSICPGAAGSAAVDKHITERLASECSNRTRALRAYADEHASVRPHSEQQQRLASSDHSASLTVRVLTSGAFWGGRERLAYRAFRGRADSDLCGSGRSPIVRVLVGRRSGSQP